MTTEQRTVPEAETTEDARRTRMASLALRAKTQDTAAWAELTEMLTPTALRVAWAILRTREDAEDVCQEAWFNAWHGIHTYDDSRRFDLWFCRIVRYKAIDFSRGRTRRPRVVGGEELLSQRPDPHPLPDASATTQETLSQVSDCVDALPLEQRDVVCLHLMEDMTFRDISMTLGVPEGTCKSRYHRALRAISPILQQQMSSRPAMEVNNND